MRNKSEMCSQRYRFPSCLSLTLISVQNSSEKASHPKRSPMAFAPFNAVVPVIAAFVIFILGYVALLFL